MMDDDDDINRNKLRFKNINWWKKKLSKNGFLNNDLFELSL